jgi:hypothetical protein
MALTLTPSLSHIFANQIIAAFQNANMSNTDTDFIILDENPVYANQISEFIQSV